MCEIIAAELSASSVLNCGVLSNLLKQLCRSTMKYQIIMITTPDNATQPFVLSEWF
ncbi:hypothetical protein BTN50_0549 [Candidatus Enterovibrio altilux]|uniref:Uncharacterized protein n=1 Tax=Candidatus Enterovibrio altilux TaxID=1927128 RepID=A0A291B7V9_9GAMM|nr:hypothetical protein BTN50_0549 [Candidatus Enterovibrio luxaltus]